MYQLKTKIPTHSISIYYDINHHILFSPMHANNEEVTIHDYRNNDRKVGIKWTKSSKVMNYTYTQML